jgi:hypothetical protein
MQIKTYPLSAIDIRYPQSDPLSKIEKEIDELVSSDPTPRDLDEYLLKQMDNSEWDQIKVVDKAWSANTLDNPIYIVAGNHEEFENYVLKKERQMVNKQNYIYVKNRYDLMGLTEIKGYYIGTAFKREDINQIKQAIAYVKEREELTKLAKLLEPAKYTFAELFR